MDWLSLLGFKTSDELVTDVAAKLQELGSKLTNWNKLSRLRTFTESVLQPTAELYGLLLKVLPQGFLRYATGEWVDLHAKDMDDERKPAVAAQWTVRFVRQDGGSGNVVIAAKTRIATLPMSNGITIECATLEAAVLPDNDDTVECLAECIVEGVAGNVGAGTMTVLVNPIAGIASASNISLEIAGEDEESDDAVIDRLVQKWDALGYGSNAAAYESWAAKVAGVRDVWVDGQHPRGQGTVDVYITGPAGLPTESLLLAVHEAVQQKRALCANVLIKSPVAVEVEIEATLYLPPTGGIEATVETEALSKIRAFFGLVAVDGVAPIAIAEDYRPARLAHVLMAIGFVEDVAIGSNANVVVGRGEIAVLDGEPQITVVRLEAK
ncbi:MAG: baseplate J/gp47 family protein [Myxococcales bacterium]|nr:baseplate J/gp47 family protein [Myxococcales bacterium]